MPIRETSVTHRLDCSGAMRPNPRGGARRFILLAVGVLLLPALGTNGRATAAEPGLTFAGLALQAQSRAVPGGTLAVVAKVSNTGEQPASARVVITLEGFPEIQSARKVLLQPGQNEQLEVYVQLPLGIADRESLSIVGTLVVDYGDREVILDRDGVPLTYEQKIYISPDQTMGVATQPEPTIFPNWFWPPALPYTSYEMAIGARVDTGGSRASANFEARPFPLSQSDWAAIDLLVVAEAQYFHDAAGVETLKRFIFGGGRVWVMLDHVHTDLVRPLLGSGQMCEEIGHVELNNFVVELDETMAPLAKKDRSPQVEQELMMKRVLQSGGHVSYTIDGWPAAITMNIGYGQLLLTTLDSRGWIEPRTVQRFDDPLKQSAYTVQPWGTYTLADINLGRPSLPVSSETDYPQEQIGNPVVPRGQVAWALLGFCGLLGGLGLWRVFAGDLSSMGVIAPIVAGIFSLGLYSLSVWVRRDIPESVSRLQIIEVGQDGTFALGREQAAVYLSSSDPMRLESEVDGRARISGVISSGIQRFEVEDFQKWTLSNTAWPPGTWRYQTDFSLATDDLVAEATLDSRGLQLKLPGSGLPSPLEDSVLAFNVGGPMLCRAEGNDLRIDGSINVGKQRWIEGALISDEQQRRLQIYQQYFTPDEKIQRPTRRLLGWTKPWPATKWSRELEQLGSALVALPVRLMQPPIGADIFLPHGLVQLRRNSDTMAKTTAFNDRTGQWLAERSMATEAEMEFVLPEEVLPFAADEVLLELDIKAPQRTVTISLPTEGESIEVARLESPSVPWKQTVRDPAVLQAVRDGVLDLVVTLSERTSGEDSNTVVTWQIDHFQASFRGHRQSTSSLSNSPQE